MVNSINGSKKFSKSSKRKQVNPKPSDVALEACGDPTCSDYGVNLIHGLVVYHRDWTVFEKRIIRTMGVMAYLSSAEFASGFDGLSNSYSAVSPIIRKSNKSPQQREKEAKRKRDKQLEEKILKAGVENE